MGAFLDGLAHNLVHDHASRAWTPEADPSILPLPPPCTRPPMPAPASCCWCRTSARHLAADLGRAGSLMVWLDAATGAWSAFALGTQRTGFSTAAAAQAAALRMARAQLEEGLRR